MGTNAACFITSRLDRYLFESVGFVDNFGAAGGKILVTELGEDSGPGLDVDGETLHKTTTIVTRQNVRDQRFVDVVSKAM
jgi:hypothetical protein